MALPSRPIGQRVLGNLNAAVVCEVYMDLMCPFSMKIFQTLVGGDGEDGGVAQAVQARHPGKVDFNLVLLPQPWHFQSCLLTEAALAVRMVDDKLGQANYLRYLGQVFKVQDHFYDIRVVDRTRRDIMEELKTIAVDECGVDRDELEAILTFKPEFQNSGTWANQSVKWEVKYGRTRSMHVSPTVLVNGLEAGAVSSGWTAEQWAEFLDGLVPSEEGKTEG